MLSSNPNTVNYYTHIQNYCSGFFVPRLMTPNVRLDRGSGKPIGFSNAVLLNNQQAAALH